MTNNLRLTYTIALIATFVFSVALHVHGQSESVLYSFSGGSDGASPYAGLVLDRNGNMYGTTVNGGGSAACSDGCGTVFKATRSGSERTLYSFGGNTDGAAPYGGLVFDNNGNLYGTTISGGFFGGTVFELNSEGVETPLYVFQSSINGGDGAVPFQALTRDAQGNLYGTTDSGGNQCMPAGCGTVFKIDSSGAETILYSFTGGADGGFPFSTLLRAANGDLYGTTVFGGSYSQGTVFKSSAAGIETVLYSFRGKTMDGANPEGGLILDSKGNLVGTTSTGGLSNNGTVFKLTPAGQETVLYSFQGGTDGSVPGAGVITDAKGNLYGTTYTGGLSGLGTVFLLTPSGRERILHSFKGGTDGASPASALVRDSKGILYGTTNAGGASGLGTIFRVVP
jgi:uncharacterized repeat protein (TIGR03803 family)